MPARVSPYLPLATSLPSPPTAPGGTAPAPSAASSTLPPPPPPRRRPAGPPAQPPEAPRVLHGARFGSCDRVARHGSRGPRPCRLSIIVNAPHLDIPLLALLLHPPTLHHPRIPPRRLQPQLH